MTVKSSAFTLGGLFVWSTLAAPTSLGQAPAPPAAPGAAAAPALAPAPAGNDGMKVLDQGPVHEAFAEPVILDGQGAVIVNQEPPDRINEVPPDVRPDGENIEWIPGYWMWTDQQQDFVWVSGVWRDVPPGRRWVPGHWTKADGGFQWVSGFWAGEQVQEVQMLPHPPETLEVGPSSPAPAANFFWIPGCWIWQNGGYGWRTGYWYAGQANWIWIPDRYCYTPRGAIFITGYWDHLLQARGFLYAPVWWPRPVYGNVGWSYRPYNVIDSGLLLSALFIHRHHHHYYFGYGGWRNNHIRPWWDGGGRGRGYDPFCSYHRWHDGRNRDDWVDNARRDFNRHQRDFNDHRDGGPRPGGPGGHSHGPLVKDVDQLAGKPGGMKVHHLTSGERQATLKQVNNWQQIRDARINAEKTARVGDGPTGDEGRPRGDGQLAGKVDAGTGRPGNHVVGRDGRDLAKGTERGPGIVLKNGKAAGAEQLADGGGKPGQASGRRLQIDTPERTPRATFKLPPVERSTTGGNPLGNVTRSLRTQGPATLGVQAQGGQVPGVQTNGPRSRAITQNGPGGEVGGGATAIRRELNLPDDAQRAPRTQSGTFRDRGIVPPGGGQPRVIQQGSRQFERQSGAQFRQGGGAQIQPGGGSPIMQGSPAARSSNRVQLPQGTQLPQRAVSPGRSFRYNPGGQQGQPAIRSGGGEMRSYRGPTAPSSSGGGRGGGEMRSFRGPTGGGGQPSARSSSGGGSSQGMMRSSGGGGGGRHGGGGHGGRGRN